MQQEKKRIRDGEPEQKQKTDELRTTKDFRSETSDTATEPMKKTPEPKSTLSHEEEGLGFSSEAAVEETNESTMTEAQEDTADMDERKENPSESVTGQDPVGNKTEVESDEGVQKERTDVSSQKRDHEEVISNQLQERLDEHPNTPENTSSAEKGSSEEIQEVEDGQNLEGSKQEDEDRLEVERSKKEDEDLEDTENQSEYRKPAGVLKWTKADGITSDEVEELSPSDEPASDSKTEPLEDEQSASEEKKRKRPRWMMFVFLWLPLLAVAALVGGILIGYSVIGEDPVGEVFDLDMWEHIYNLIYG
ncbi:DNA-directed RNA polymerase subunit beta [Melghirimyces algeriensis]|uniref:DNA-directed RNA polymerase subunit beta n=1 Tax=Melghirimyces algeriensis TaxID=910412 RepID=A0A521D4W5_9BACL|nr:DNA-directed RNA polymerase subunit beta [Melghirimyces algeriensis]SMO66714.1 DNA-directed RNA polymerase subunit beta [Melghirimyces algeriensis]